MEYVIGYCLCSLIGGMWLGRFLSGVDHKPRPEPRRVTNVDIREGDDVIVCPHCHRSFGR